MSPRPKVFIDSDDGSEWRCVDGKLQCRMRDYDEDDLSVGLEPCFGGTHFVTNAEWIAFLEAHGNYRVSAENARLAIANPMTVEEAAADDALIAALPSSDLTEEKT